MATDTDIVLQPLEGLEAEYQADDHPTLLEVTPGRFLMTAGEGGEGGELLRVQMEGLYRVAGAIHAAARQAGQPFNLSHPEAIWEPTETGDDVEARSSPSGERRRWRWKLLVRMPNFVDERDVEATRRLLSMEAEDPQSPVRDVVIQAIDEGTCVQMLHVGHLREQEATQRRMRDFMQQQSLEAVGGMHEIYISDLRTTRPEQMETIIRQPVVQMT